MNTSTFTTATQRAAAFVAGLDESHLPVDVAERVRTCMFYGWGIGLLCLRQETACVAARSMLDIDGEAGPQGATLLLTGRRVPVSSAAFANAVLLHSRCQEDTSGTAHLGISVLSAALALVEAGLAEAKDLVAGIAAGYEVGSAVEAACGRDTLVAGLRGTPLYGTVAVAATAARLLRLPADRIGSALANAASFTGGLLQSIPEGTDEWRYQAGAAARHGLIAALLARAGSVSAERSLEGEQGFARAFAGRALAEDALHFGSRWRLRDVTFKPYPVCAHNQTSALLGAKVHKQVKPERIASIRLHVNPFVVPGMDSKGPFTRVSETLMSTYFCCATGCLYGTVSMARLQNFDDPAVTALMRRITLVLDDSVAFPSATAEVTDLDGRTIEVAEPRKFSDFGLSREEVNNQLYRLASEEGVPAAAIQCLNEFAFGLPTASPALVAQAFAKARAGLSERSLAAV